MMDTGKQKKVTEILEELVRENLDCEDNLEEVQQHYEELIYNQNEMLFDRLCKLIEKKITGWISNTMKQARISDASQKEDALQEGRIGLLKALNRDIRTGCVKDTFIKYAVKIYKNNTFNVVRERYGRKGQNEGTVNALPLEAPGWENGATLLDRICTEQEDSAVLNEQRKLYRAVFIEYCRAILDSDEFALKNIALLYARVFPHMFCDISDSKQASAKQGHKYMKDRSVEELKDLAERILKKMVDRRLAWGEGFLRQLEEPSKYDPENPLKDLVYTKVIDQKQTSHWADAVHKNAVKAAYRAIKGNRKLLSLLTEYLDKNDALYVLVDGGNKK